MNGVRPKIEIFKPFGEAFELTNKILFQPFDLKKWLVIGFAAFLSGHLAGIGFNFPSPFGNFQSHRATQDLIPDHLEQWKPWLVAAVVVLAVLFFAFVIALTWLKARGHFIFTDCIVRNQAAIAAPWREYRKEGNSYFLFLLAVLFVILLLAGLILASAFGLGWLKHCAGDRGSIASIGLIVFLFVFWVSIVIFVSMATYFMVPVMYRKRCRAVEAFRDVTFLMFHHVGSFFFVLLVWSCFHSGCTDDRRDRDMRDLLSGGASIHWDGQTPASICLLARVHTRVPSPVRSGLRCVGKLYAG